MKTHWKKSFDSPYIGSWDLDENQTEITLTIKEAKSEMTKGLKENSTKNVIYFEEDYKPMIVNSGNSKIIKSLSGSVWLEDWKGTRITLYVKEIRAFGETHDALRIREKTKELPVLTKDHPKFLDVKKAVMGGNFTVDQVRKKYQVSDEVEKLILKNV